MNIDQPSGKFLRILHKVGDSLYNCGNKKELKPLIETKKVEIINNNENGKEDEADISNDAVCRDAHFANVFQKLDIEDDRNDATGNIGNKFARAICDALDNLFGVPTRFAKPYQIVLSKTEIQERPNSTDEHAA